MANPKLEVLTPQNSQVIFIDHQPQMAFGVQSIDRQMLKNNTVALAKAAKVFEIPTTITTVETQGFSGPTYPELLDLFPGLPILERTSMNSWDDQKVRDALAKNGKKKVIVSGLWTEVCNNTFALCAMQEGGYEIYMVADASGGGEDRDLLRWRHQTAHSPRWRYRGSHTSRLMTRTGAGSAEKNRFRSAVVAPSTIHGT